MLRVAPFVLLATLARAAAWAQAPAGSEFQVNTYTTGYQGAPRALLSPLGRFVVSWTSPAYPDSQIFARRFLDTGPLGGEFRVNTTDLAGVSALASRHLDGLVAVWDSLDGIRGQRYTPSWVPEGAEFRVSTYTTSYQYGAAVAPLPGGGFVVSWSAASDYDVATGIAVRRFDSRGQPLGPEVLANLPPQNPQHTYGSSIASAADGRFVVVWYRQQLPIPFVFARAFDASGNARGSEFLVNTQPLLSFARPRVAMAADGAFVIVWQNGINTQVPRGIRARLFSPPSVPVGEEFVVKGDTLGRPAFPSVAAGILGDFVVSWSTDYTLVPTDIIARRFAADGTPRGGEFLVNTYTTGRQVRSHVASDAAGNFVVTWTSDGQDGSDDGVFVQRFGGLLPAALDVDTAASGQSDGNRVLEPGETVDVRPWWRNVTNRLQFLDGTLPGFDGPPGATYTVTDASGGYGSVPNAASQTCSDCYAVSVSAPAQRPQRHWDAGAREHLLPEVQGQRQLWRLHVGDTFADVPRDSLFYRFVETLVHNRVTAGCAEATYCPLTPVTREQMAVFVVVARDRAGDPPPACGTPVFTDVPAGSPFCRWIEELARRGVVSGCGGGNYCPSSPVSREQMPVFVLRTLDPALDPPACTTPMFSDVPADSPFCRWIEELARRDVVGGCGGGRFCPLDPVTREQMAVFIAQGFGLQLYAP